ncbi:unnamed protein product [Clonostachys rosea]|uniref:Fungal N-terminal domain-containing protein n=1 Tax=Bionectria ochroleuca TaxID=29856 RepID=A0ABY6UQZ7_BIOOC|nr:unnamed protein product [Clonostachys rosea]
MEVLGAVASAATLAQIAVKGVEFLQKFPEIQSDYSELCSELEFIQTVVRVAQQTTIQGDKTTSKPGIQDQVERTVATLEEISNGLDEIKAKCQHRTAKGDVRVSKTKWVVFSSKVGGMLQKAHRAKTNLQMAIAIHMSTLHHQTNRELRDVKCLLDISLPGIERRLDRISHTTMVMISTPEQILKGQTERNPQRIEELDDEGNELDGNDTSATEQIWTSTKPDAPSPGVFGQRTTLAVAFQKTDCPVQCWCRCHTRPRKVSSPQWVKKLTGLWELQYKPSAATGQWDMRCPCCKSDELEIAWKPPEWWRINPFFPGRHGYSLKWSLRPARVLLFESSEKRCLDKSVEDVRQAMVMGMALFPNDEFEYGLDVIEILLTNRNFDLLEFLLLQWKNILLESGLSRNAGHFATSVLTRHSWGERELRLFKQIISYADCEAGVTTSAIHEAAIRGSGVQESCVEAKDLIDTWDETGFAPLHHAVRKGHIQAVQDLIDAGADVNCKLYDGQTPLMLATLNGHSECMRRLLLSRRINRIDERNRFKLTALHHAATYCHSEAVRLLLEEGASPLLPSNWHLGNLPLHLGAGSKNKDPAEIEATINLLLNAPGTDIDGLNKNGETAIMEAVGHDNHVALRCLAHAGASFTAIDKSSQNMLHLAARYGDLETLHFLDGQMLTCINWRLFDKRGYTPWDRFIRRMIGKVTPDAIIAFVQLFRGIRDRDLAHDISLLEKTLAALDRNDDAEACLHLSTIIQNKEKYRDEGSAGFYRGLKGDISCGDKEALLDDIRADVQDLRLEMASSPWDQGTLHESDSDESSDDDALESDESDEYWYSSESNSDSDNPNESSATTESDASNGD